MKDLFSKQALEYAKYRPDYPEELFTFICKWVKLYDQAWDAGTGNGQAAGSLSKRFANVLATDISERQLSQAVRKQNIRYEVSGEHCSLPDNSCDLITVAQAIHWFDRDSFYQEVRRVARPGAPLALWGYGLLRVNPIIDQLTDHFCNQLVGPYWDPERRHIDTEFRLLPFPFDEIESSGFYSNRHWTVDELLGYLRTWSAVKRYQEARGNDPVDEVEGDFRKEWKGVLEASFPIFMRIGVVKK